MTQGGKPVTVLPGLMAMSPLGIPGGPAVGAVPAMMPLGAAVPRLTIGAGAVDVITTVARPNTLPLVARTVLVKVPVAPPDVNTPLASIVPPPLVTDHTGEMAMTLPFPSRAVAANCCCEFVSML